MSLWRNDQTPEVHMVIAGGIFPDGKRWEHYLTEIEMIEVDTEYAAGDWEGIDPAVVEQVQGYLRSKGLDPADMVRVEGSETTIERAFDRASKAGQLGWFAYLADDV